jgi:hypothetical protein
MVSPSGTEVTSGHLIRYLSRAQNGMPAGAGAQAGTPPVMATPWIYLS